MTATEQIVAHGQQVLIGNYARLPVVMARGVGSRLWDTDGREYIDLFAGFGGCVLGHCHPELIRAATEQMHQLWHVGNTFYTQPQLAFADQLKRTSFDGRAFFCHSGLEANEAAVKLARLHGAQFSPKKWKVVSLNRSFHGRSLAMIAATGNPAVKAGFDPAVPGFSQVELGDLEGLAAAVDDETASVMLEPIQGEGGIHPLPPGYAHELRKLCDARKVLLHYDEVWTCGGRTGEWFGHQHYRTADGKVIEPDIMTLGKAIGGGLPVGTMWCKPHLASLLVPGKHGCTLGANGVAMAVAAAVFDTIEKQSLVAHARVLGEQAVARLKNEKSIAPKIAAVRGKGLFIGIEFKEEPKDLVKTGLANGIVINLTQKTVCRIAPAINITAEDLDQALTRLVKTIESI
jgi:acetylornithine/N-succinyldiaminopimelate aminotransferase